MTGEEYKANRERLGTQAEVASRLGVARSTVADRERGDMKITIEAAFAILWLVRGGAGGRKRVAPKRRKAPNDKLCDGLGGHSQQRMVSTLGNEPTK